MSPPSHAPRDYQIAELTHGIQLPLPSLQRRHIMVIAEFLASAWTGLLTTRKKALLSEDEPEINALMEARLDVTRLERPEWSMLMAGVSRGKESVSFDGRSLEKRPDLSIHLTQRPFRFPLVVECKLIDAGSRKAVAMYCDNGIARFLEGEYAWYAHEAFMLAYVRDGATIASCLMPHLEKNQKEVPDPYLTEQLPQAFKLDALAKSRTEPKMAVFQGRQTIHRSEFVDSERNMTVSFPPDRSTLTFCEGIKLVSQDLARSRHGRRFPTSPGSIEVWHLWLT